VCTENLIRIDWLAESPNVIVVLGEAHLRQILRAMLFITVKSERIVLLNEDAPVSRPVQRTGSISSCPILGGLIPTR
jgi:hypothetical protein